MSSANLSQLCNQLRMQQTHEGEKEISQVQAMYTFNVQIQYSETKINYINNLLTL